MSSYINGRRTRLARIWNNMKKRCYNERHESYKYYGAKGVTVCDEWKNDFGAFESWANEHGYNDSLTIDRIDCNGDYSPENCRWATPRQQAYNRSSNHLLSYQGITMPLYAWADKLGINIKTLCRRIYAGWDIERALCTPVDQKYSHAHCRNGS